MYNCVSAVEGEGKWGIFEWVTRFTDFWFVYMWSNLVFIQTQRPRSFSIHFRNSCGRAPWNYIPSLVNHKKVGRIVRKASRWLTGRQAGWLAVVSPSLQQTAAILTNCQETIHQCHRRTWLQRERRKRSRIILDKKPHVDFVWMPTCMDFRHVWPSVRVIGYSYDNEVSHVKHTHGLVDLFVHHMQACVITCETVCISIFGNLALRWMWFMNFWVLACDEVRGFMGYTCDERTTVESTS